MSESFPKSGDFTRPAGSFWVGLGVVGVLAVGVFALHLPAERPFADESAYYTQTYYADLFFRAAWNDPAWLDYPAYDLPPLPKYLIGGTLMLRGYRLPTPLSAWLWYDNIDRRFDPPGALTWARLPSVFLGALGCIALYVLGTLLRDSRVGLLAALFLMVNPLYRLHARRAMSDVPAEAFLLLALAAGLWGGTRLLGGQSCVRDADSRDQPESRPPANPPRRSVLAFGLSALLAGICGGLSALSKLNGALAMMILVAWAVCVLPLSSFPIRRRLLVVLATGFAGCISLVTFVALNPFLTAHPPRAPTSQVAALTRLSLTQRARFLVDHRLAVARGQRDHRFSPYALRTPIDKLQVAAVQGFGRFGLFGPRHSDSTHRYDWRQDWGVCLWLPWVLAGGIWAWRRGRAQLRAGVPPTGWAILAETMIAAVVVTSYLPLAWDRYLLSLQAGSCLLAAGVLVAAIDRIKTR